MADFLKSKTDSYGYFQNEKIAAITEVKSKDYNTHIQSLVVNPKYFWQRIGEKLVRFVFETYDTSVFSIETRLGNLTATSLYKKIGFTEMKPWNTDHGVRKIRFEKLI